MTGDRRGLSILVLCAGNIGRSPLGEVMLRSALASALRWTEAELHTQGVVVTSAGTEAPEGHAASDRGLAFAAQRGLDLSSHRAHSLTKKELVDADLVLCMDLQQVAAVAAMYPGAMDKTELMAGEGIEIPDPHHRSDAFFLDIAERIESAVQERIPGFVARIQTQVGKGRDSGGSELT
jgi:protein-tyrosine phosphatase